MLYAGRQMRQVGGSLGKGGAFTQMMEGKMSGKTLTRADLAEAIYEEVGLSRNESAELVEAVLSEVSRALVREGSVKISSFGSFNVRRKGARVGRNPRSKEEVPIEPRKVISFKASHVLKDRINDALISE